MSVVTQAANAPRGSARADAVATAQCVVQPASAACARASRAMRLLPTPAAPCSTTPDESGSDIAACMAASSSLRPVSGHVRRTQTA